jgi:cytochrome c551/c552
MRQTLIVASVILLLLPAAGFAADGKAVFERGGCRLCHKAKEGIGPSLSMIASAYRDKKDALLRFLNGETQPAMLPEKFLIMKPALLKTKALSKEEQGALADYLLSQK